VGNNSRGEGKKKEGGRTGPSLTSSINHQTHLAFLVMAGAREKGGEEKGEKEEKMQGS